MSSSDLLGMLTEIYIYPIKSLSGIKLQKAEVTKFGLAHPENNKVIDRKWLIIDTNGSFKTQRQLPRMALIKLALKSDKIVLTTPCKKSIEFAIEVPTHEKVNCRVWKSYIDGYVYPKEIGDWLSDFLEFDGLSLVGYRTDLEPRMVSKLKETRQTRETDCVMYSDYSPFMLIGESSLADLNQRLDRKVTTRSFRPNFVPDMEPPLIWSR